MSLKKDIQNLLEAGVISEETAAKISAYYKGRESNATTRLLAIFGVIGGLLVGMGVVLIVAHNWDHLSRPMKTFFAFLPLLISQLVAGFSLWKKSDSTAWREGSASVLFFAIAACISMVSQIYNLEGELGDFMLIWMLLALPIVYIMRSSMVGIFCLMGITYLGVERGYFNSYKYHGFNWYWMLFVSLMPYYMYLHLRRKESNFLTFYHWLIPLSLMMCLGMLFDQHEEWLLLSYMALLALFFAIGNTSWFKLNTLGQNGFKIIGSFGMVCVLLGMTFRDVWLDILTQNFRMDSFGFVIFLIMSLTVFTIIAFNYTKEKKVNWKELVYPAFLIIFLVGMFTPWAMILVNILVLAIAIVTIKDGSDKEHLGILNYGLIIVAALIACRFFDAKISFVIRGVLFVLVGIGFFLMNYWMLKNRNHGKQ